LYEEIKLKKQWFKPLKFKTYTYDKWHLHVLNLKHTKDWSVYRFECSKDRMFFLLKEITIMTQILLLNKS